MGFVFTLLQSYQIKKIDMNIENLKVRKCKTLNFFKKTTSNHFINWTDIYYAYIPEV